MSDGCIFSCIIGIVEASKIYTHFYTYTYTPTYLAPGPASSLPAAAPPPCPTHIRTTPSTPPPHTPPPPPLHPSFPSPSSPHMYARVHTHRTRTLAAAAATSKSKSHVSGVRSGRGGAAGPISLFKHRAAATDPAAGATGAVHGRNGRCTLSKERGRNPGAPAFPSSETSKTLIHNGKKNIRRAHTHIPTTTHTHT